MTPLLPRLRGDIDLYAADGTSQGPVGQAPRGRLHAAHQDSLRRHRDLSALREYELRGKPGAGSYDQQNRDGVDLTRQCLGYFCSSVDRAWSSVPKMIAPRPIHPRAL
jgi:hypothetical protein